MSIQGALIRNMSYPLLARQREDLPDRAMLGHRLVDGSIRLRARVVLGDASSVVEAGRTVVAAAGIDLHRR